MEHPKTITFYENEINWDTLVEAGIAYLVARESQLDEMILAGLQNTIPPLFCALYKYFNIDYCSPQHNDFVRRYHATKDLIENEMGFITMRNFSQEIVEGFIKHIKKGGN